MITIIETKDFKALAELNEHAQNLHVSFHPEIFKPYNRVEVEAALKNFLSDPNCHSYILKLDDIAIGYGIFFIRESRENAFHYSIRKIYIDQISVLPEYQKMGAGKMLMLKAEQLAKEYSIGRVELDHWTANTVAAAYFRKNGYKLYREMLYKSIE